MTINLSPDMQQKLSDLSARRQVPPEELVREALAWYLQIDPDLLDEFAAWQEVRDEATTLVEKLV